MTAAEIKKSPITTHVLDTTIGKPGAAIEARLYTNKHDDSWSVVGQGTTNTDGRIASWGQPFDLTPGVYRIEFFVERYFRAKQRKSFYPVITVTFEVTNPTEHYHVPILLSDYGYSTYRGS